METRYVVTRDLTVLNPEHGADAGIGSYVTAAYNAFVDGRHGWDIRKEDPEFDVVPVTLFSPGDEPMSIDDRRRWDAALRRFGLQGN